MKKIIENSSIGEPRRQKRSCTYKLGKYKFGKIYIFLLAKKDTCASGAFLVITLLHLYLDRR